MKRWEWGQDNSTWVPVVKCPYCGFTFSPCAVMFPRCVVCDRRVRKPKKDYWDAMKDEVKRNDG